MQHSIFKFLFRAATVLLLLVGTQVFSTLSAQNKVLVEKFTGTWCGWCPNGDLLLDSLINNDPRFILVNVHWNDVMSIPDGDEVIDFMASSSPSASFNRKKFDEYFKVGVPWNDWADVVPQSFSGLVPFEVNSETTFDEDSRELSVNLTAYSMGILNGDYRVNAYVVQEEFESPTTIPAYNQSNYFVDIAGHPHADLGDPIIGYQHDNLLRAMLGGAWGLEGVIPSPTQAQTTYSTTFTYTVPDEWDENGLFIVAVIQEYDEDVTKRDIVTSFKEDLDFTGAPVDTTNTTVEDSTETVEDTTVTIQDTVTTNPDTLANALELVTTDWQLYPNPANEFIFIKGTEPIQTIEIWNINGQLEQRLTTGNLQKISVSELATGLYLMKVETDLGQTWMRFLKE